jgi:hypothetical protein
MYYLAMLTFVSTLPNAQLAIGLVTASELIPQLFSSYTGYRAEQTHNVFRKLLVGLAPLTTFLLVTISAAVSPFWTIAILFISSLALMSYQIKSNRFDKSKQYVNL